MDYEAQTLIQDIERLRLRILEDNEKKKFYDKEILKIKTALAAFDQEAAERKQNFINKMFPVGEEAHQIPNPSPNVIVDNLNIPVYNRNTLNQVMDETKGVRGSFVNKSSPFYNDWERSKQNFQEVPDNLELKQRLDEISDSPMANLISDTSELQQRIDENENEVEKSESNNSSKRKEFTEVIRSNDDNTAGLYDIIDDGESKAKNSLPENEEQEDDERESELEVIESNGTHSELGEEEHSSESEDGDVTKSDLQGEDEEKNRTNETSDLGDKTDEDPRPKSSESSMSGLFITAGNSKTAHDHSKDDSTVKKNPLRKSSISMGKVSDKDIFNSQSKSLEKNVSKKPVSLEKLNKLDDFKTPRESINFSQQNSPKNLEESWKEKDTELKNKLNKEISKLDQLELPSIKKNKINLESRKNEYPKLQSLKFEPIQKSTKPFFEDPGAFVYYDKDINRKKWDSEAYNTNKHSHSKSKNPFTDKSYVPNEEQKEPEDTKTKDPVKPSNSMQSSQLLGQQLKSQDEPEQLGAKDEENNASSVDQTEIMQESKDKVVIPIPSEISRIGTNSEMKVMQNLNIVKPNSKYIFSVEFKNTDLTHQMIMEISASKFQVEQKTRQVQYFRRLAFSIQRTNFLISCPKNSPPATF